MENLSQSRPSNRGSTSVSKKVYNGNNGGGAFVAQTIYDDVYGGPPKFGVSALSPRFEDYGEIFGSFHALRASSIPILDLPAVDETEVFFDARSSAFDYGEVFGGFDGLDFAVSYEDLINSSKGVDDGSSDEAWTPAGTESLSDCSDHSGNSHSMLNGDSNQSFGGSTEFSISYNRVKRESNGNISNGKTHITQLQVLPGSTHRVDEANPLQKHTDDDSLFQATDDRYLNIDFDTGKVKGKHLRNNTAPSFDSNGHEQLFEDYPISLDRCDRDVCRSYEDFITVSEISLRTEPCKVPPPSRPPPMFTFKKRNYTNTTSNCMEAANEVFLDDHSQPLFDVKVDASSSAAASAAAMKEAMEKAQAQLQNAKDLWERKKEGVHGRVKMDPKKDVKEKEGNLTKVPNQFKDLNNERLQAVCEIHDHEIKVPAREERPKVVKCATSFGGEEILTAAEKAVEDRHESGFLVSEKHNSCSEWKEATEFFELVRADISGKEFKPVTNDKILNFVREQVESEAVAQAWEHGESSDNKVKPFLKDYVQEVKNIGSVIHGKEEDIINLKANRHETRSSIDKKFKVPHEFVDTERKVSRAGNIEKRENHIAFKLQGNELEADHFVLLKDLEQKKKSVVKRNENEIIMKESLRGDNYGNKVGEAFENVERDKLLREASEREKLEQRIRIVHEEQENKKKLNLVLEEEENLKGQNTSEQQLEGVSEEDVKGKREENADNVGLRERLKWARMEEDDSTWPKYFQNREECEAVINDSFQRVDIEDMPRDASKSEESVMMVNDSHDMAELKGISVGHDKTEKDRLRVNSTVRTEAFIEVEDLRISSGTYQMDVNKNHLARKLTPDHNEKMGMSQELFVPGQSRESESRVSDSESSPESDGIQNLQFDDSCASSICEAEVECNNFPVEMEDAGIPLPLDEKAGKKSSFEQKPGGMQAEAISMEGVLLSDDSLTTGENEIENNLPKMENMKKSLYPDGSDEKAGRADVDVERVPVGKMKFISRMDSCPEPQEKKLSCRMEDKGKFFYQVEEKEQKVSVPEVKDRVEKEMETENAQPTTSERTQKSGEFAHEVNSKQATERKENGANQSHASKGNENDRVKSETEFENDILQKLEEEREREREREKDRMPIDRIALEPRERAAAETRERAERAALERLTTEARQRTLAEARERLVKACAEARENSLSGKASMEARVKAERAAVERATAEARERAAEKAISERTSIGVRERIERSVSDKFSASSRSNEMRQKSSFPGQPNLQSQSFSSSIASRYTYYSVYDERNEGLDGESPQRCKARLERYQRTAERAAKALAEKNMRDLLAQREQAERNRLAETLDADVKRWSSGKEGNLRALLSTLQYILGPDSGWQPIPLTEVITAAAVKKAYRKATLCVHPDKLQQRGASIQQKYICEKVFDLLKEAWNKFNSEER